MHIRQCFYLNSILESYNKLILQISQELDHESVLREGVHEIVMSKYHLNNTPTTIFWDTMQHQAQCCGSSGPSDWAFSLYNGYQDTLKEIGIGAQQTVLPFTIPSSCCR